MPEKMGPNKMRWSVVAAGMAMLAATPAAARTAHSTAGAGADRTAIEKIEDELGRLTDPNLVARLYAPDAVLYDGFTPGFYRGTKAIADSFAAQLKGVADVRTDFLQSAVEVSGNLGAAYSLQRIHVTMKDGTKSAIVARVTDIYRKHNGRWLISHQHISYAIDAASGKGAFDYEPKH